MARPRNIAKFEPVLLSGFVRSVLYAAVLFGFDLTEAQIFAVVAVVESGVGLFVRQQVIPVERFKTNKNNRLHNGD